MRTCVSVCAYACVHACVCVCVHVCVCVVCVCVWSVTASYNYIINVIDVTCTGPISTCISQSVYFSTIVQYVVMTWK